MMIAKPFACIIVTVDAKVCFDSSGVPPAGSDTASKGSKPVIGAQGPLEGEGAEEQEEDGA
jgi:hypothetical protein